MRKKIIITTIAIISLTAAIAAKNHTPAANTNSIACTADMQKSIAGKILRFHVLDASPAKTQQDGLKKTEKKSLFLPNLPSLCNKASEI